MPIPLAAFTDDEELIACGGYVRCRAGSSIRRVRDLPVLQPQLGAAGRRAHGARRPLYRQRQEGAEARTSTISTHRTWSDWQLWVRPLKAIDVVFCTHLHHDHCGWNTVQKDGRWVPTFSKRNVPVCLRMSTSGWDTANPDRSPQYFNPNVFDECVTTDRRQPGKPAFLARSRPGIRKPHDRGGARTYRRAQLSCGSSPDSVRAYFTGDAFHHPVQMHPASSSHLPGCDDLETAITTRERLVRRSWKTTPSSFRLISQPLITGWLAIDGAEVAFVPAVRRRRALFHA